MSNVSSIELLNHGKHTDEAQGVQLIHQNNAKSRLTGKNPSQRALTKTPTNPLPSLQSMIRPSIARSFSTGGLPKLARTNTRRSNKSLSKLSSFHPSSKLNLGYHPKSGKLNTHTSLAGHKSIPNMRKAVLMLHNDEGEDDEFEDYNEGDIRDNDQQLRKLQLRSGPNGNKSEYRNRDGDPNNSSAYRKESSVSLADDFENTNNIYGGSMLLSQSTGLTRKIGNENSTEKLNNVDGGFADSSDDVEKGENGSPSLNEVGSVASHGISFKAKPMQLKNQTFARPVMNNENVSSSHVSQLGQSSIKQGQPFTNQDALARRRKPLQGDGSEYPLPNQGQKIETRTQQRLWLMRENSLMDMVNADSQRLNLSNLSLNNIMFPTESFRNTKDSVKNTGGANPFSLSDYLVEHSSGTRGSKADAIPSGNTTSMSNVNEFFQAGQNQFSNPIHVRTEFERLNREYLNVRRNLNPVGECLNRLPQIYPKDKKIEVKKIPHGSPQTGEKTATGSYVDSLRGSDNSTKEEDEEVTSVLSKLWQGAIISAHSDSSHIPSHEENSNLQEKEDHQQSHSISSSYGRTRLPQRPTTRAVKMAEKAQAQTHTQNFQILD